MKETIDISHIAEQALSQASHLVSRWFPNGRQEGSEWAVGNLMGDPGDSLKINIQTGKWSDFATGDRGGDLVSLIAAKDRTNQLEAAKSLAAEIGQYQQPPSKVDVSRDWHPIVPVPDDAPAPPDRHFKFGVPSQCHWYHNAHGKLVMGVYRYDLPEGKQFTPVSYGRMGNGNPEWRFKSINGPRPLYNLPSITKNPDATVVVCEGEKAANAANQLLPAGEYIATTSSGGANAASKTDWSALNGRRVVIWPDDDEAGQKYAQTVCELAGKAGANCTILDVAALPKTNPTKGWDAADALEEGTDVTLLKAALVNPPSSPKKLEKKEKATKAALPEIEPWPDPVDGEQLADDIMEILQTHLALPQGSAEAICLWCIFTHALDAFYYSPRLFFSSPEKQCGKSTALKIILKLVSKPLLAANISPAAIYRIVDGLKPTLLLDEADTYMEKNEDLRGVLNSGHDRETATIVRCDGDKHDAKVFSTWACYAIAGIGRIPATLEDRSVIVHMRRRRKDEQLQKFRPDRAAHLKRLAQMAKRWADDNFSALEIADPILPGGLGDRAGDNWSPLLAIADTIGGRWPEQARQAAAALQQHDLTDDLSFGVQLLSDIKDMFDEKGVDKAFSVDICQYLAELEERPWAEFGFRQKAITPSQLAKQLKKYSIRPQDVRIGNVQKGYKRDDFEEAWGRYLPSAHTPEIDATTRHATKRNTFYEENQPCSVVAANSEGGACRGTDTSNSERFEL